MKWEDLRDWLLPPSHALDLCVSTTRSPLVICGRVGFSIEKHAELLLYQENWHWKELRIAYIFASKKAEIPVTKVD